MPVTKPFKLNQKIIDSFVATLKRKVTYRSACAMNGVPERTFYKWKKLGREDFEAGKNTLHARFFKAIEQAEAEVEAELLEVALEDGNGARWFLARRFRDTYGDRIDVDIKGDIVYNVVFDDSGDEDEE